MNTNNFLQAPSFYWELEICSFGDIQEESSAFVSFGFAPAAEKKDGSWTNPVGTCLFLKYVFMFNILSVEFPVRAYAVVRDYGKN